MSRTRKSAINAAAILIGQLVSGGVAFISRTVFISALSAEYLGINGLFSNILGFLSLAELGVGTAIVYSLYKPLADGDTAQLASIMAFFKKIYTAVGIVILLSGLAITPFIGYFVKEVHIIPKLHLYFMLFVINSSMTYFFAYKQVLIAASQNEYVVTIYHQIMQIIRCAGQIAVLLFTGNFMLYLLLQFVMIFIENLLLFRRADKMFPWLKDADPVKLDEATFNTIKRNTSAMFLHRIGGFAVFGTDNLLISKFVGLAAVGIYSNYTIVIGPLGSLTGRMISAAAASAGNLSATESPETALRIFYALNMAGVWLFGVVSISIMVLINPFIELWIGKSYLLSIPVLFVLVVNFYLTGMRSPVGVFKSSFGLFRQDRYKALVEGAINLIASIILFNYFGLIGIFIGTTLSTLTTCFWIEPYVVFRWGFQSSPRKYFKDYALYTLVITVAGALTMLAGAAVPWQGINGLLAKMALCALIPNAIFFIAFSKTVPFLMLRERVLWLLPSRRP